MNLLDRVEIQTDITSKVKGCVMTLFQIGDGFYGVLFEELNIEEPFRSVTNSVSWLHDQAYRSMTLYVDKPSKYKLMMFTGFEEGHPYYEDGFCLIKFDKETYTPSFRFIGKTKKELEEFILIEKLKFTNDSTQLSR